MAEPTTKLTTEEARGLAALGQVAGRIRGRDASVTVDFQRGTTGVEPGEVVLLVMSADGALLGRRRVRTAAPTTRVLRAVMMGAEVAVEQLATQGTAPAAPPPLSAKDAELLDRAGFIESPDGADPLEHTRVELELMLRTSATLEEAARELKVSTGRLRQRLSSQVRTLYGIKVGGRAWRLPRFQFAKKGRLVRNVDQVLPSISPTAHPLSVHAWFTSPHQDLVVGPDDTPVTPIAWLEAGHDPALVARLAAEV